MTITASPIERAFELASSGKFHTISEIKIALRAEGYDISTVTGGVLSKQLRTLLSPKDTIK